MKRTISFHVYHLVDENFNGDSVVNLEWADGGLEHTMYYSHQNVHGLVTFI